ncbi:glycerol-3-phosphate dehydrogenase [Methylonatrum kenyense]|uniref:glycerol-3-phosphate dehydrogenase n=1 Tax=Methylonatrum kenyense TaxID=455253 RepID=UPI0020C01A70|nr:glycerol-3-phosphate dehydrogenase [Methylonatrum kenyense]MCK8516693.1 glycerol-3-phosphate dehydrogenase [Methylonatrum kenyense]
MRDSEHVQPFDLLIAGGGINGAGIARDAAGRGLRVLLCERDDLAAHTSSASTKLIHGGLRYLEHYAFRLVAKALRERELLLRAAPHIIWPLRFVMPHVDGLRPRWMIRAGLFLYDALGGCSSLPRSHVIRLDQHPAGESLNGSLKHGYAYSDCGVEDARLVVLNALDAAERGATIRPRTEVTGAERENPLWRVELRDSVSGRTETVRARALINATGPWVGKRLNGDATADQRRIRLVKGSHLVVPRIGRQSEAYILQNPDRRIVFVIPYEGDYSLVGTTEELYTDDPAAAHISEAETDYLLETLDRFFGAGLGRKDIVWTYSGVRPLVENQAANISAVSRDYQLTLEATGGAPLLTIYGGKITTFRRLAEDALSRIAPHLGAPDWRWTAATPLPGGDIPNADFDDWQRRVATRYRWLDAALCRRLCRAYGTRVHEILGTAAGAQDLGEAIAPSVFEAELRYLHDREWARCGEDVLWRRSKLGLHLSAAGRDAVNAWFEEKLSIVTA